MQSLSPSAPPSTAITNSLTAEQLAIIQELESLQLQPSAQQRQSIDPKWWFMAGGVVVGCFTLTACTLMLTNAMSSGATSDAINASAVLAHEAITSKSRPNITCISFDCGGLEQAVQQAYDNQPSPLAPIKPVEPDLETLPDTQVAEANSSKTCSYVVINQMPKEVCY